MTTFSAMRRTANPAALFSVEDVKDQCRIEPTSTTDEGYIATLIAAAEAYVDGPMGLLGRALVTQTIKVDLTGLPSVIRLPITPVSAFTGAYYDADNAAQTLSASLYRLHEDDRGSYLRKDTTQTTPTVYDRDDAVTLTLTAGYGAPSDVPSDIRQALLMLIAHWYENREAVAIGVAPASVPFALEALLSKYKRVNW